MATSGASRERCRCVAALTALMALTALTALMAHVQTLAYIEVVLAARNASRRR